MSDNAQLAQLRERITAQGIIVRDLKTAKADVEEIKAAVAELLALKNQLPEEERPKPKVKAKKGADDRAAKKAARAAARYAKADTKVALTETYGYLPLNMSQNGRPNRVWHHVKQLDESLVGQSVLLRGYLQSSKAVGKNAFLTLRQTSYTVQCFVTGDKSMVKFATGIPSESVVDVQGVVSAAEVKSSTQSTVEVKVEKVFCVQKAANPPFLPVDASRSEDAVNADGEKFVTVNMETRLDSRFMDLRTPVSQAVFKVSSEVCQSFRNYLVSQDFVEIQTPKLLGGQSEGGADVFKTEYFGRPACLAQSPQLHKQISAACSGFERVFEIGPVFRAENSNTSRHLCEFHGLDVEMAFKDHYHEVLDLFSDLFHHVFNHLNTTCADQINVVRAFNGFDDLIFECPEIEGVKTVGTTSRTLLLNFPEAIQILREAGVTEEEQGEYEDFSTPVEKKLGALVKEKYGVDFYFLDKFPLEFRPFYTMGDPENPKLSNSYDFFIRGQEILSGAQRVHDVDVLESNIKAKGIPPESVRFYIDAFKYGALPHGGGGVGLERVIMLFLNLPNIRHASLFPRDPVRLIP